MKKHKKILSGFIIVVFLLVVVGIIGIHKEVKADPDVCNKYRQTVEEKYKFKIDIDGNSTTSKATYKIKPISGNDITWKITSVYVNNKETTNYTASNEGIVKPGKTMKLTINNPIKSNGALAVDVNFSNKGSIKDTNKNVQCKIDEYWAVASVDDAVGNDYTMISGSNDNSNICNAFISGNYNSNLFTYTINGATKTINEEDFNNYKYVDYKADYDKLKIMDTTGCDNPTNSFSNPKSVLSIINNAIKAVKRKNKPKTPEEINFDQHFRFITDSIKAANGGTLVDTNPNKVNPLTCNPSKLSDPLSSAEPTVFRDPSKKQTDDYNYANKNYFYHKKVETIHTGINYVYHYAPGLPKEKTTEKELTCKKTCEEAVAVEYGAPIASKAGMCFEYKVKVTSRVKCKVGTVPPPTKNTTYCNPKPMCYDSNAGYHSQGGPNEDFESCIEECDGGKYTQKCSKKCYKKVYGTTKKSSSSSEKMSTNKLTPSNNSSIEPMALTRKDENIYYYDKGGNIHWSGSGGNKCMRWYDANNYHPLRLCKGGCTYACNSSGFYVAVYSGGGTCQNKCWIQNNCKKNDYLNPNDIEKDNEKNSERYAKALDICNAEVTCKTNTSEYKISIDHKSGLENGSDTDTLQKGVDTENKEETDNHILSYHGCYYNKGQKNWYQTVWSFPGTWVNDKNGDISYKKPSDNTWRFKDDKFCFSLKEENVNVNWWKWVVDNEKGNKRAYNPSTDAPKITNNIKARTKDFGYFDWNISMNCFYALNSNFDTVDNPTPDDTGGGERTVNNYVYKAVALDNLFPKETNVGFNWTAQAKDTTDISYPITPISLRRAIQERRQTIYDERHKGDYLDYYFELDRETLQYIREYSKSHKKGYADFSNEKERYNFYGANDNIVSYSSPLLQNLKNRNSSTILGTIGCNNQRQAGANVARVSQKTGVNCEYFAE